MLFLFRGKSSFLLIFNLVSTVRAVHLRWADLTLLLRITAQYTRYAAVASFSQSAFEAHHYTLGTQNIRTLVLWMDPQVPGLWSTHISHVRLLVTFQPSSIPKAYLCEFQKKLPIWRKTALKPSLWSYIVQLPIWGLGELACLSAATLRLFCPRSLPWGETSPEGLVWLIYRLAFCLLTDLGALCRLLLIWWWWSSCCSRMRGLRDFGLH